MDNFFFRRCFPHRVEIVSNTIIVYSQQPNVAIFKGVLPANFDIKKFFNDLAFDRKDYIGDTICYLYDANENPVGNMTAFDKDLMDTYKRRLFVLLNAMRGINPV